MAETESLVGALAECAERRDFEGAFALVRGNRSELAKALGAAGIRDALKKTTGDRLLLSFLDSVEFDAVRLDEALLRLEKLVGFQVGSFVLSKAWGLGKVRRLDSFYRRITVDFKGRPGHQFTYAAATDMLNLAPENHILVQREGDPARVEMMLRDAPGDFVKAMLASYGDMTVVKLEDLCVANGFVKSANWKAFWNRARTALRADKLVQIPVRRTDPIQLRESAEEYGDGWMTAFVRVTDPKLILAEVREYAGQGRFAAADEATRKCIGERLAFAVTAARKVDDALYARLACLITELGFATPAAAEMRGYLWERKRFIRAAEALPAREVGAMIAFLADSDESKAKLCAAIPEFCFTAVTEVVAQFRDWKGSETVEDPAEPGRTVTREVWPCRREVGRLMKESQAPATLVTLVVGRIEQFGQFDYGESVVDGKKKKVIKSYRLWDELPPVSTLLTHAIALGEGRRGGETLKMQNIVRRLFADEKWLDKVYELLAPADKVLFFERFQASIAWDPSTHHAIVVRMVRNVPELEAHLVKVERKREYARVTSYRSFAMKKAEYLKLINEDMPANVKRIEFAKSYGDLSENAEYQYAKDEQRALMQKQSLMQADLEAVKPSDFADASVEEVMPGVMVVIAAPDGERTYAILGEWDNDVERGILSSKARLAANMLGKKAGDEFELPGADGAAQFARVVQIMPLTDEIREWMKLPAGMQI